MSRILKKSDKATESLIIRARKKLKTILPNNFLEDYYISKLQKERLNQMIENALSYKQEVKKLNLTLYIKGLKT